MISKQSVIFSKPSPILLKKKIMLIRNFLVISSRYDNFGEKNCHCRSGFFLKKPFKQTRKNTKKKVKIFY